MLDESQLRAASLGDGPHMVLAGPGSGKTTVITERVCYLIKEMGVSPGEILVVTFTKAAAGEMRSRFLRKIGTDHSAVTFGTFHAVFFQILKNAYHLDGRNILKDEMRFAMVRDLVRAKRLSFEDENEFVGNLLQEIGLIKNNGIDLSHYFSSNCSAEVFRAIFTGYEEEKQRRRLFDFDDMLSETYRLLLARDDILSAWRGKFRYILIDEFQDINRIQYEVMKLLAAPLNNLFIVGDDDQSIYRFRGAKPEIMLHFPKDFEGADSVLLRMNYRCPGNVVAAASNLIRHNKNRFEKDLESSRGAGEEVRYIMFPEAKEEYDLIAREILDATQKKKYSKKEIALLFRTNRGERRMIETLMQLNIPFRAADVLPNLYEHWIAKDLFAYFELAGGSNRREDLLRIMNRPKRYLSRDLLTEETFAFDVLEKELEEKPWILERLYDLEKELRVLSGMNPFAGINYIRRGIGYDEFIPEYAEYRGIRSEELFDTLDELQEAGKGFRTFSDFKEHIAEYTKELARQSRERERNVDAVNLCTLHSAKGLEYDCVYLVDVNEGVMPYHKAVLPEDLEEERRMVYVGMTRAKKRLTMCSVKTPGGKGSVPSAYIKECQAIPGKKQDFQGKRNIVEK